MNYHSPPIFQPVEVYSSAVNKIATIMRNVPGVVGIYQIGHVSEPGISDVDMIIVFDDGTKYTGSNPIHELNDDERYLFTHSIFGISESNSITIKKYSLFHNYKLIFARDNEQNMLNKSEKKGSETETALKEQIGKEYLFSNYIARKSESQLGLIHIRKVLLSAKAIIYDLDFLGIGPSPIREIINQVINLRKKWFDDEKKSIQDFKQWYPEFTKALFTFIEEDLAESFYLPFEKDFNYSRNLKVLRSDKNLLVPIFHPKSLLFLLSHIPQLMKLARKLPKSELCLNYTAQPDHIILKERNLFLKKHHSNVRQNLNGFGSMANRWNQF